MSHHGHIRVAKARNVDGNVCGEMHHRAKDPDAVVALARDIAEANGWGARRTSAELRRRGYQVSFRCVKHWILYETRTLLRPGDVAP